MEITTAGTMLQTQTAISQTQRSVRAIKMANDTEKQQVALLQKGLEQTNAAGSSGSHKGQVVDIRV